MTEEVEDKTLHSALDLMRRLPPSQLETNLQFTLELVPELTDDLLQTVDCPLKVKKCSVTDKDYLLCDYNRDGDSYRSPWSNKYEPPLPDGVLPPDHLREMEIEANAIFQSYCHAYYEGGVSSCYFWEVEEGFAACVLFKKDGSGQRNVDKGIWDSIHVFEVKEISKDTAKYQLSTTIILSMSTKDGKLDLSGSIQRQDDQELKFDDKFQTHIVNMGNMLQAMENKLRDSLNTVYFDKAREITSALRSPFSKKDTSKKIALANELQNALSNRRR